MPAYGNVGIGTTIPSNKSDIVGNISTTGDVCINKSLSSISRSICLSPTKTNISNLFATKRQFAFA